jgi:hypothetical protein
MGSYNSGAQSWGYMQFLREWTFPEEDRALFTTASWRGEYRWFRSPNVIPIEQWRRKKAQSTRTRPDESCT